MEELRKGLRHRQKIIKLADKSEADWLAVKENQTEELTGDSWDEKMIKKAQERALKKKKQNRGMITAFSIIFSMAGNCSQPACHIICVFLL